MTVTCSMWRDQLFPSTVLKLTAVAEGKPYSAQVDIPDAALVAAYLPGEVFRHYIQDLVKEFNKYDKKLKIVQTANCLDEQEVPIIMLPYNIGLVYDA